MQTIKKTANENKLIVDIKINANSSAFVNINFVECSSIIELVVFEFVQLELIVSFSIEMSIFE